MLFYINQTNNNLFDPNEIEGNINAEIKINGPNVDNLTISIKP